jgi:serine/threonine-protein kinase ATR
MAPVPRGNGVTNDPDGQMNRTARSNDAPPSTLAAHLVNNLSTSRRPSKNQEHEDFQLLLTEVSKYEEGAQENVTVEAVVEHHHKRIYVVVKAVLEILTKEGPISNEQDLIQQASDGLQILIATIKETPGVLEHVAGPQSGLHSGVNVPLWIWLFPRLLSLIGRQRCQALQQSISEFFLEAFNVVARSPQLWALNSSFFRYLQHCADSKFWREYIRIWLNFFLDILIRLNDSHLIADTQARDMLGLVLPLVNIEDDVSITGHADLHVEGCTYALNDVATAAKHVGRLLSILSHVISVTAVSYDATPAFQGYLAWILDSMVALHEVEKTYSSFNSSQYSDFESCAMAIDSVHSILTSLDGVLSNTVKRKGCWVLVDLCATLIEYPNAMSGDTDQNNICQIILDLAVFCAGCDRITQSVRTRLLPGLARLVVNLDTEFGHNSDVKVCPVTLKIQNQPHFVN